MTRLALYCVCDHDGFHELQDRFVLEQCPWHPEKYLGTPCRRLLERTLPLINVFLFRDSTVCFIRDSMSERLLSSSSVD